MKKILPKAAWIFFLLPGSSASKTYCQQAKIITNEVLGIQKLIDANRIEGKDYNLIMHDQDNDTVKNLRILNRHVTRDTYLSEPCIKIIETCLTMGFIYKITVIIDSKTLRPIYYESISGDSIVQRGMFENGKMIFTEIRGGVEKKTVLEVSTTAFLSNSFSEIIQSANFKINPVLVFETFTPGKPANKFIAERIGEKDFITPLRSVVPCWIIKFRRIDPSGTETFAGYRYVDKGSGMVLFFRYDMAPDKLFTYQVAFLE